MNRYTVGLTIAVILGGSTAIIYILYFWRLPT